ncbi:MAG TPA: sulfite reductase subunit A [Rhodospirillaceae bacterium]|nr:sulfite reductase subunit A [Rhodospirillaceae bacterium]
MTKSRVAHKHKNAAQGGTKGASVPVGTKAVIDEAGIADLLSILAKIGYTPIGPKLRDGAIVYEEISALDDFPVGMSDEQEGGKYRVVPGTKGSFFEYVVGPTSWKHFLFPPKHKIWSGEKDGDGFKSTYKEEKIPSYAFIGVRSCELEAIKIQDKVFGFGREDDCKKGIFSDPGYVARRSKALIVAVNCSRAASTCFCTSMGGDPHVKEGQGFDLALTELSVSPKHEFLVEVGSEPGALIFDLLPHRAVRNSDTVAVLSQASKARSDIKRRMIPKVKDVLQRNLDSVRWDDVAERCMSCANCTLVCPTCFCSTVEETTDLTGDHAERWRSWDSCFSTDFSYIHGGAIRTEGKSRYRQWITHKLANWHDQYGSSGCVGCGRCITWCPVGIDITKEAKAIKDSEK